MYLRRKSISIKLHTISRLGKGSERVFNEDVKNHIKIDDNTLWRKYRNLFMLTKEEAIKKVERKINVFDSYCPDKPRIIVINKATIEKDWG